MSAVIAHTPRAPRLAGDQRRFAYPHSHSGLNLVRFSKEDTAIVGLDFCDANTSASVSVNWTAEQCREAARVLLDAAHDLDTHTAASLKEAA